ncbi:putative ATP-dependent RNA helicase DHX34 [Nymphon striatum]|nr:putative ATP-dependent RNA helicase DHX34 [Nymphon striatum]
MKYGDLLERRESNKITHKRAGRAEARAYNQEIAENTIREVKGYKKAKKRLAVSIRPMCPACTNVWVRDLGNYRYPVEKIGECPTQYGKKDPRGGMGLIDTVALGLYKKPKKLKKTAMNGGKKKTKTSKKNTKPAESSNDEDYCCLFPQSENGSNWFKDDASGEASLVMEPSKNSISTFTCSDSTTSKESLKNMKLNTHKAGMEGLDTNKINEIILEASKGSKFYQHKQARQKQLEEKIKSIKQVASSLSKAEIDLANKEMDSFIAILEKNRNLSRIIVHVDMDAFYASVEMRDDPSLIDKPIAVGSMGMLVSSFKSSTQFFVSTSNYVARRYGVRAAMPGFIGIKLCPQLVLIQPNFEKYTSVSKEIQEVFKLYDPDFSSVGLDEAYLDITDVVDTRISPNKSRLDIASDIINEMRSKIFENTHLTASAGIAPNMLLAKITSDMNKPNGQFLIKPCADEIKNFIKALSIRKVSGVGPVCEQQLNALGVETFSDVLEKRGLIYLLFSSTSSKFFIQASLGIGNTVVKSDHVRKSISVERTFSEINDLPCILEKCSELCEDLVEDMKRQQIRAKTITIKLKTVTFQVKTRSFSLPEYISDYNNIFKVASKLIMAEQDNLSPQPLKLRLMGVRASNLKFQSQNNKQQPTLNSFISDQTKNFPICPVCTKQLITSNTTLINKHIEECLDDNAEPEDMKTEFSHQNINENIIQDKTESYECPVCGKSFKIDLVKFNEHVDSCLSSSAIKEIIKEENNSKRIQSSSIQNQRRKLNENTKHSRTISSFFKPVCSPHKSQASSNDEGSQEALCYNQNVGKIVQLEEKKSESSHLPFEFDSVLLQRFSKANVCKGIVSAQLTDEISSSSIRIGEELKHENYVLNFESRTVDQLSLNDSEAKNEKYDNISNISENQDTLSEEIYSRNRSKSRSIEKKDQKSPQRSKSRENKSHRSDRRSKPESKRQNCMKKSKSLERSRSRSISIEQKYIKSSKRSRSRKKEGYRSSKRSKSREGKSHRNRKKSRSRSKEVQKCLKKSNSYSKSSERSKSRSKEEQYSEPDIQSRSKNETVHRPRKRSSSSGDERHSSVKKIRKGEPKSAVQSWSKSKDKKCDESDISSVRNSDKSSRTRSRSTEREKALERPKSRGTSLKKPLKTSTFHCKKHDEEELTSETTKLPETGSIDSNSKDSKNKSVEEPHEKKEKFVISEDVYTDIDFVWTDYKSILNKMFFFNSEFISSYDYPLNRGSKELDDFWSFFKKYQTMQRRRISSGGPKKLGKHPSQPAFDELEDVPESYVNDFFERLKVPSLEETIKDLYFRVHMYDRESQRELPRARVLEFRYVVQLYLNFCFKQEFNKIKKLRMNQKNLPISQYKEEIVETLKHHQVILVAGDTGCGKSTQVPQYLIRSGYEKIACTQPRRIACISLCKRVAFETLNEYKSQVGYQIRFDKSKTQRTRILFLTEGLLLRQVCTDSALSSYNVIVLDEVHERHLHGDFLLGVLKCLIQQRKDIKIVLMSATINIELFVKYFNSAPVIQVPGRLFPIEMNYRPISVMEKGSKSVKIDPGPYVRILQLIDKTIPESERGDLLVFLSGIAEITTIADAAQVYAEQTKRWIILPLHSTLSISEQDKIFDSAPEGVRKCIISTNIAETSITIDGIRFVVDSGKVKEMNYDTSCKMQKLKEFWISCASAEQRKGRAGRTGPGVCYRLYSEKEYGEMSPYSTPEIQRVPLDALILQMLAMGLPDPRKFPFIEPPSSSSIENAVVSLIEHGALDNDEILTPIGKMLSNLPVEISIGKMLIMGSLFRMVEPALSLASALSVQSPFTNSSFKNPEAMNARKCHESDYGDPITLLNIYNEWLRIKADRHENSRKWCRKRGIEEQRLYELTKLRRQFKDLLKDCEFLENNDVSRNLTSIERTQRHGEMKHLKKMKFSYHNAPRTRKVLKLDFDFEIGDAVDDDNDDDIDIKDVEFRMSNNDRQMKALVDISNSVSNADLTVLKVIVCSGIFPSVAIADEHNSYKPDSEQLFHTKLKPYVVLHPNGIFANQPEVLQVKDSVSAPSKEFTGKGPLSQNHQLLTYVIVCDKWIELKFVKADEAQQLILFTIEIRDIWQNLLQNKLKGKNKDVDAEIDSKKLERQLSGALIDFYHDLRPLYTMKRMLAADIKHLYKGASESGCNFYKGDFVTSKYISISDEGEHLSELFQWINDVKPNEMKGGMQLKEYVTYNCLLEEDSIYSTQKVWKCKYCEEEIVVTVLERMRHESQCKQKANALNPLEEIETQDSSTNVVKRPYFCPDCQEELHLTSVQILKHKKSHSIVS